MNNNKSALSILLVSIIFFSLAVNIIPVSTLSLQKQFDPETNTLTIFNSGNNNTLLTVQQLSHKPGLCTCEEIFNVTSYVNYTLDPSKDFKTRWIKHFGRQNVTKVEWEIKKAYNVTIPDYGEAINSKIIPNIISYENITDSFDELNDTCTVGPYNSKEKWNITRRLVNGSTQSGIVCFDDYNVLRKAPLEVEVFWTNHYEKIGEHEETRYKWISFSPVGKTIHKDKSYIIKLTFHKKAELGAFSIQTIPMFRGVEEPQLSWWNGSWSHRKQWTVTNVNATTLTNYPAYINVSDEAEMQVDWDDVVFTDSNSNIIPYELENYTASYADYWVNISSLPGSGTYTGWMYYGNDAATSQENPEGVWDEHYAMVQHLQEAPTNGVAEHLDSTSNNNDGTPQGFDGTANSTTDATGQIDGADIFSGVDEYISCGNDPSLNCTDAITIEAWVKPISDTTIGYIVAKGAYGSKDGYMFEWRGDFDLIRLRNGRSGGFVNSNAVFSEYNEWVFITVTKDESNNIIFYHNGVAAGTASLSLYGDVANNVTINGDTNTRANFFNGTIDEVRISSTACSADWINQSYEMVVNQSTWVSWGSAEQYPSTPVITGNTTYNFGVNFTFTEGSGYPLDTDSYNISWSNNTASGWQNGTTDLHFNHTTQAHGHVAVDVWAYNSTEGKLSETAASDNVTVPNNAPVITNTSDWQGDEGELVYLDFDYTDLDGDTCTFSTNATEGSLNSTTGAFEWQTNMTSQGTYFWNFTISDGYDGEDYYVANITVNDLYHPDIVDWWNNYTSNNLTHFTIAAEDNRTVFFNVTSNQSDMTWYWYKDGDLMQSGASDNYTATWDVGGIDKTIEVYGANPNGQTQTLTWTIYIEYTAHEIEWLKLQAMYAQTEAEEMLGQTWLFLILLLLAFVFLAAGYLAPNGTLKIFGAAFSSLLFFILAYAIIGNQFGDKLQMGWLATLLGALGLIQAIYTLLLVISLLYMAFTSKRQAGENSIPYAPDDRNW